MALRETRCHFLERALGLVEILDVEGDVRAERVGLLAAILTRDDMQRVVADPVPRAAEAEVRPRNPLEAHHVFIEGSRLLYIADAKRRVIERFNLIMVSSPRLKFLMHFAAARDVDRLASNIVRAAQINHRLAISAGVCSRFKYVLRAIYSSNAASRFTRTERRSAIEHVGPHRGAQKPGHTALTRMFKGPSSSRALA